MVLVTMGRVARTPVYYYWGEGGEYGPFDIQQEGPWAGWPNAGQVMRYFRNKAGLSGPAFGERYGKMVNDDGKAIGEGWIYDMETDNTVPVDIGRRKIIADLLNIPPMLFGLAVLEDRTLIKDSPESHPLIGGQTTAKRFKPDIEKYENTFSKDQRPIFTWIDIITAESHLQMRQYDRAADLALQSLKACLDLRFSSNVSIIRNLYGRLLGTSYRNSTKVTQLGNMLRRGNKML